MIHLGDIGQRDGEARGFLFAMSYLCSMLHNQELSVLYGGPTLNYGGQLSLYVPHMLRVNMTRDLARLQLSDLQGEIIDLYAERLIYRKNAYMPNVMAIFTIKRNSIK